VTYFRCHFKLGVAGINACVTAALVVTRLASPSWSSTVAWRCAFLLMEKGQIDLKQLNRLVSWKVFLPCNLWKCIRTDIRHIPGRPHHSLAQLGRISSEEFRIRGGLVQTKVMQNVQKIIYGPELSIDNCRHLGNTNHYRVGGQIDDVTYPCIEFSDIKWSNTESDVKSMSDRLQGGADLSVLRPKTDLRTDEYNYAEKVYQHLLVFNLNNTSYFVNQNPSSPLKDRMEDDPTYSDGITYLSRNIPYLKTCSLIQDEEKKAACYKGNDCGLPDNWLFDGYLDIAIRAGSYSRNQCGATEPLTNIFGPASLPSEAKLFSPWAGV
jgi:hypothetical protein